MLKNGQKRAFCEYILMSQCSFKSEFNVKRAVQLWHHILCVSLNQCRNKVQTWSRLYLRLATILVWNQTRNVGWNTEAELEIMTTRYCLQEYLLVGISICIFALTSNWKADIVITVFKLYFSFLMSNIKNWICILCSQTNRLNAYYYYYYIYIYIILSL